MLSSFFTTVTKPGAVLLFVIAFTVTYFIFAHEGFYWLDDYFYTKYGWQLQQGIFDFNKPLMPPNPITNRVVSFAPAALFFAVFGVNIYAATFWPLLCTLGCSVLIYFLYRKTQPIIASLGIILLGLYFHTQFLATYFYPDNILMFFAFASVAVLFYFRFRALGRRPWFYAAVFVFCNFLAFLSKETILYYLPFYLVMAGLDFFSKKHTVFWLASLGLGGLVLTAYFTFYYFETGDFFHRFSIIEQTNDAYHQDAAPKPFQYYLSRLTMGPIWFFMGSGIYVPFIFALGLLLKLKAADLLKARTEAGFWLLLAFLVLLQFWFGSTSLQYYNPITLLPRMCMVMMPPLGLAGAFGLHYFLKGSRKLAGFYTILFAVTLYFERGNMLAMYVPLTLFFGYNWWRLRKPDFKIPVALSLLLLILVLVLRPLHFMRKPALMAFQEQNEIIKTHLTGGTENTLVFTDPWLQYTHDFHYGFKPDPNYQYRSYTDTIPDLKKYNAIYLLVNRAALSNPDMAKMQQVQEPEIDQLFPRKTLVKQEGPVLLYKLD